MDALLVLAAVGEQRLQLGAVGGFGRLAPFHEHAIDLVSLSLAEVDARLAVRRQVQVLGLLRGRTPTVDDGAHVQALLCQPNTSAKAARSARSRGILPSNSMMAA